MNRTKLSICLAGVAALAACSHLPDKVDTLEQARIAVRNVERDELASEMASSEINSARNALAEADQAYRDKDDLDLITHKAYVAQRYADIAKQRIAEGRAKQVIAQGEATRNQVVLQARAAEAENAAQAAEQRAQNANRQVDDANRQAELAREQNQGLEKDLTNLRLQPKETERGLVLTLGDVLFDTAQNALKPGAARTIQQLAAFMSEHPDRKVLVEGHTDARGADDFNMQLSERRADSVRDALVSRGVSEERVRTVGLGESYPVASNDTPAGMQANRRVEIVISDENGNFPGADREASLR